MTNSRIHTKSLAPQFIQFVKSIVCVIFGLSGIYLLFSNISYCEFMNDEYFQMLSCKDYTNAPLAMGTFFIGHIWCDLFGWTILSLRILARICIALSIGSACAYFLIKTRNWLLVSSIWLFCCLLATLSVFGIYNWDTGAYPSIAFGLIIMICYIANPCIFLAFFMGLACGIMTFVRLPFVTFIILCLAAAVLSNKTSKGFNTKLILIHCSLIIFTAIVIYLLAGYAVCGSIKGFFAAFNSENLISGHNPLDLSTVLWHIKQDFPYICISWFCMFLCFYCARFLNIKDNLSIPRILVLSFLCMVSGWSVLRINAIALNYDTPLFGLGFPLIIITTFFLPFFFSNAGNSYRSLSYSKVRTINILLFCAVLILGIGSDIPFGRWNVTFILPISLALIIPSLSSKGRSRIYYCLSLSTITMSAMWAYRSHAIKAEYLWPDEEYCSRGQIAVPAHDIKAWEEIDSVIKPRFKANKNVEVWGTFRYPIMVECDLKSIIPISLFHFGGIDMAMEYPGTINKEYIILSYDRINDRDNDPSIHSLIKYGFNEVYKSDNFSIMKKAN